VTTIQLHVSRREPVTNKTLLYLPISKKLKQLYIATDSHVRMSQSPEPEETFVEEVQDMEEEDVEAPVMLNAIAQPLADMKLSKKLLKLIKKSVAHKNKLHRGLRNVQTRIRKGGTGICVLAGDVTPIDIYCHLPIVCEDKNIPYCFVPSKKEIATSIGAKRPCIVVLISEDDEYKELYDKCYKKVSKLSC